MNQEPWPSLWSYRKCLLCHFRESASLIDSPYSSFKRRWSGSSAASEANKKVRDDLEAPSPLKWGHWTVYWARMRLLTTILGHRVCCGENTQTECSDELMQSHGTWIGSAGQLWLYSWDLWGSDLSRDSSHAFIAPTRSFIFQGSWGSATKQLLYVIVSGSLCHIELEWSLRPVPQISCHGCFPSWCYANYMRALQYELMSTLLVRRNRVVDRAPVSTLIHAELIYFRCHGILNRLQMRICSTHNHLSEVIQAMLYKRALNVRFILVR